MGDLEVLGWITVGLFMLVTVITSICVHEERKERRRLNRYRPTHDNRYPHRDEWRAFMRDCK